MRIDSPCMGCMKRYINCHSECLDYVDYKQKLAVFNELRDKEREQTAVQCDRIRRGVAKVKAGHNRGGAYERPKKYKYGS